MRLLLVFIIIPSLWYHPTEGRELERVKQTSGVASDVTGKKGEHKNHTSPVYLFCLFCLGSDALKPDDVTENDTGKVINIPSEEEFKERPKRQLFLAAIAAGTVALKKIYTIGTPIRLLRDKFQADLRRGRRSVNKRCVKNYHNTLKDSYFSL